MQRNIKEIIEKMTLEEKAGMCSGKDFWHLKSVERVGVPEVMVCDGPHGLRKQLGEGDHLGITESEKAVCFPAACATACSFDRDLIQKMGERIGAECQAQQVSIILGPAVNIKRSPLCGRNFEYFSEDPYLTSQMAVSYINGVQSQQVGTSLKHFAANNQEYRRMTCSSEVDEQTFREIYLAAFETAVREAKPQTVMCSYNKINGEFAAENHRLLTEILRDEWGFEGYVMSDWGAVNDRVKGLCAGMDLEMPGGNLDSDKKIVEAVQDGTLSEEILDKAVERILKVIFQFVDHRREETLNLEYDAAFAAQIAAESMVLLKNEGTLPLPNTGKKIAFIGKFAEQPRYQGGGSSHIHASKVIGAWEACQHIDGITYAQGYVTEKDETDHALFEQAVETAKAADIAIVFAGLPEAFESEGYDRLHLRLPECQNQLIDGITKVQQQVVVVLHNGSAVEMPWADNVSAILMAYLGGQSVGEAEARILFGTTNPSGKLAETLPYKLADNPSYLHFPGDGQRVVYQEGIFVGYRYYATKEMPVRFPFGHGLSYTSFAYDKLRLSAVNIKDTDLLTVSCRVKNTGDRMGKEAVQLYVCNQTGKTQRPLKELKGFEKITLEPGEEKTIEITLDRKSFARYSEKIHDWCVDAGEYQIQIGASSEDIRLKETVHIQATVIPPMVIDMNTTIAELMENPQTASIINNLIQEKKGRLGLSDSPQHQDQDKLQTTLNMVENAPLRALRNLGFMSEEELKQMIHGMSQYYCNPVNISYRYQFHQSLLNNNEQQVAREAADPSMIEFLGRYYIFASMTLGVWVSDDLAHWKNHPLPENLPLYDYAPDVRVMGEFVYFSASRRDENCDFYRTKDVLNGPYEKISGSFDFWDPNLFVDDDKRVYFYWGCSNDKPIFGVELDPVTMHPIGEKKELIFGNPHVKGFERVGEDNTTLPCSEEETELRFEKLLASRGVTKEMLSPDLQHRVRCLGSNAPYIEGVWMDKFGGTYYLQYAFGGTRFNIYGDGVYQSDSPLGPFTLATNNPYSYKPGGFIPGAGHGSTMQDISGNLWHTATMRISMNNIFERRVGIWPAGLDQDGELYCDQRYGDWPLKVVKGKMQPWQKPEWMLLSYGKQMCASSFEEGKEPNMAADENVQTWWKAASAAGGEWLQIDLGAASDVRAVQINFADDKIDILVPGELQGTWQKRYIEEKNYVTRWRLEGSVDGEHYVLLEDKSQAVCDLPHDFLVWEQGQTLRFLKLTILEVPYQQKPCISGLRVFGIGSGQKPQIPSVTARRTGDLDMEIQACAEGAMGYNILWGHTPEKLYHSYMTFDTVKRIGALVKDHEYYVRVDAFNEAGITEGVPLFICAVPNSLT